MNSLDWIVVVAAVFGAVGGYRLGFVARVMSWVGFGFGLWAGARIVPTLLAHLSRANSTGRLFAAVMVVIGLGTVGLGVGAVAGSALHRIIPLGPLRLLDRAVGAGVGVLGVLVALWLLLPAISSVHGWPARATRQSAISRWVSDHLPNPPRSLDRLERLVGQELQPDVFATLHPGEATGPPPALVPLSAQVQATVAASTVKVEGQACGRIQEGSGFTIAHDLVLTNAHVVAGEPPGQTEVVVPSGSRLPATVVRFDPDRDVALLSVAGLPEQPLSFSTGQVGQQGAVFGHPGGQTPLAITPAAVAREITAVGEDLYDTHTTRRDVFVLAAYLAPGDSGGALVDPSGQVIGVAFAVAIDRSGTAYALTSREVSPDLSSPLAPVSTQGCLTD